MFEFYILLDASKVSPMVANHKSRTNYPGFLVQLITLPLNNLFRKYNECDAVN